MLICLHIVFIIADLTKSAMAILRYCLRNESCSNWLSVPEIYTVLVALSSFLGKRRQKAPGHNAAGTFCLLFDGLLIASFQAFIVLYSAIRIARVMRITCIA